jgi:hypothetical protein
LFNPIAKSLLALVLFGLMYYHLSKQQSLSEMVSLFTTRLYSTKFSWLLVTFILLPFNWLAETLKWYPSMRRYEEIGFFKSYQAVLAGVSFSLFTPNRVGEYGGRVLFVSAPNRWKAFIINIVGNFAQIMVILAFGLAGLMWLYAHSIQSQALLVIIGSVFSVAGVVTLAVAYFNIDIFVPLARRVPVLQHIKRYVKDITVLRQFPSAQLRSILFWSAIRYLIYCTQYYCMLQFYQIAPQPIDAYSAIFALFLLQTGVPLPPILGLVARGSIAVQIFGWYGADPLSALATTFTLWVINLILPSLVGIFCVFNLNLARLFGYEKS